MVLHIAAETVLGLCYLYIAGDVFIHGSTTHTPDEVFLQYTSVCTFYTAACIENLNISTL